MKELDKAVIEKTMANLKKNNFGAYYVEKKEDVVPLVKQLVKAGSSVANGGSVSLKECGVMDLLASGEYVFFDRTKAKDADEQRELYIKAYGSDAFFCSSNAVTQNGELYNVDGNSNRVSCIVYGPKQVIMVVGYNKIVENIDEAIKRVKECAAPPNSTRLDLPNYCAKSGKCVSLNKENPSICDGCDSPSRICCNYVVSAHQRHKDRIKVIIVGEKLGY